MKFRFLHVLFIIFIFGVLAVLAIHFWFNPHDNSGFNYKYQHRQFTGADSILPQVKEDNEDKWDAALELATFLSEIKKQNQDQSTIDTIHELLEKSKNEDIRIRQYLILTLGVIGNKNSEKILIDLLHDASNDIRVFAIRSLGSLQSVMALEPLVQLLKSSQNISVLNESLIALRKINDPAFQFDIYALTKHPERMIRNQAWLCMGYFGYVDAKDPLKKMLEEKSHFSKTHRVEIINAIHRLEDNSFHRMIIDDSSSKNQIDKNPRQPANQSKNLKISESDTAS